jgi:predicted RNase H-like HicB family nuclease
LEVAVHKRYAIVLEKAPNNWGAYAPDVPGCIATGPTREVTLTRMHDALQAHIAWMARDGDPIPEPETVVDYVEVEAPARPAAG